MTWRANADAVCAISRRWQRLLAMAFLVCIAGCNAQSQQTQAKLPASNAASAANDVAHINEFREFSLTIYGYNYTDSELGSFEVNGRGGGNLEVSTPTAGGSKSTCCAAMFTPLPKDKKMTIKWNRDGDTWCEQDVPFSGPVPSNAEYMEVHFYRDGHIELAVTPVNSPPRLKLDRLHGNSRHADPSMNVNNDSKYSRCKLGYR